MAEINLQRINREILAVRIKGTAPLIVHRFGEKARQMMLDAQMGKARVKKAPKNPQECYEQAFHRLPDGHPGFPASGFKGAIVAGARYFDGITMTGLKSSIFVIGEGPDQLVPIIGEPRMREDAVRNETGVADLRFRPEFVDWSAELRVLYVPSQLTTESVLALVDAAGLSGIGEGRPNSKKSMTGTFGTFEVVDQ